MIVATTRGELAAAREKLDGVVGLVPTMGALHDGHEALMRAARERADHVLVTIFVNPLQFGPNEDFDRYPRTLDRDLAVCARNGVDVVFAPDRAQMYPDGEPQVRVDPGPLGEILEGASRPGFFHGVLTVVLKLFHLTRPDLAFFGEKDYQQLTLIRRMVRDTDLPIGIVGVPTVREPDGLALSSRNRYLSEPERRAALALSRALRAGAAGPDPLSAAHAVLSAPLDPRDAAGLSAPLDPRDAAVLSAPLDPRDAAGLPGVDVDYLALTDPDLGPPPEHGPARLLVAARVGGTRLIDNARVEL